MDKKPVSGRKFMTICFSTTYCFIMILITGALLKKLIQVETYIALVGGFALVVKEIANDYFKREDRKKEE